MTLTLYSLLLLKLIRNEIEIKQWSAQIEITTLSHNCIEIMFSGFRSLLRSCIIVNRTTTILDRVLYWTRPDQCMQLNVFIDLTLHLKDYKVCLYNDIRIISSYYWCTMCTYMLIQQFNFTQRSELSRNLFVRENFIRQNI